MSDRPARQSVGVGADDLAPAAGAERHHVCRLIEFLTNLTEPSAKQTLTPPGWLLVGAALHMVPHQYVGSSLLV